MVDIWHQPPDKQLHWTFAPLRCDGAMQARALSIQAKRGSCGWAVHLKHSLQGGVGLECSSQREAALVTQRVAGQGQHLEARVGRHQRGQRT